MTSRCARTYAAIRGREDESCGLLPSVLPKPCLVSLVSSPRDLCGAYLCAEFCKVALVVEDGTLMEEFSPPTKHTVWK